MDESMISSEENDFLEFKFSKFCKIKIVTLQVGVQLETNLFIY